MRGDAVTLFLITCLRCPYQLKKHEDSAFRYSTLETIGKRRLVVPSKLGCPCFMLTIGLGIWKL